MLLKARFIDQSYKNYSHDALHIHAKTTPIVLRNQNVLNNLPGEVYLIESNSNTIDDCRNLFSVIQSTQNQNKQIWQA